VPGARLLDIGCAVAPARSINSRGANDLSPIEQITWSSGVILGTLRGPRLSSNSAGAVFSSSRIENVMKIDPAYRHNIFTSPERLRRTAYLWTAGHE
jgi:hypothetical protein